VRQGGPGGADHAEEVDVQDPAPLLERVVLDRALGADAGVVDQHVQAAPALGHGGHGGADRGVVGHVGDQGQGPLGALDRLGGGRGVQVEGGHPGPPSGQQPDRGQTDAGPAAGDRRDQTFELPCHRRPPLQEFDGRQR
jgi:hypothetical protein